MKNPDRIKPAFGQQNRSMNLASTKRSGVCTAVAELEGRSIHINE